MLKITISPNQTCPFNVEDVPKALAMPALKEVKVNMNVKSSSAPSLEAIKLFSTFLDVEPKRENAYSLAPAASRRRKTRLVALIFLN